MINNNNILNKTEKYFNENNPKNSIFIIDLNLYKLWKKRIDNIVGNNLKFIFESTEKNKSCDTFNHITTFMFENKVGRDYTIFAMGGGIIGDLTGFVASTYMRGIRLVHIPTTLLSMVDSSIGGKTGYNNIYGKNMIGSIYPSHDLIIDTSWLETLPKEHIINGMAEVIKMALIKGGKLFDLVMNSDPETMKHLDEMIHLSAKYKLDIIGDDSNDTKGSRELLNLGHTWGHALEFSQNILHGFAVADGIIEEMKYTNYYYDFPSMSVIKIIYDLLKKWTLIKDSKSLQMNDISKKYDLKLPLFYLSNDKKSNRLISLEDVGIPKTVEFDIEKWKFLLFPSIKIKNNIINSKNEYINFNLPGSKSVTNRALICSFLKSFHNMQSFYLNDVLISEDTELMIGALKQSGIKIQKYFSNLEINTEEFNPSGKYYLGNSGTSVRFLLPILALATNKVIELHGSVEMKKRPIKPLVDCLNNFGCNITSIDNDDMLPLVIKPKNLDELEEITIDGTLSSQYISGIMFGLVYLLKQYISSHNNLPNINIVGSETSKGFIILTKKMLEDFGFKIDYQDNIIKICDFDDVLSITHDNIYNVEGDATALSYLIGWSFINKQSIMIENLNFSSSQSDINVVKKMVEYFGKLEEKLIDNYKCLIFDPFDEININDISNIDLDSSDTFLTWACLFAIKNINVEFSNISNQNWKECSRIDNFINNLEKLGGNAENTETGFKITKGIDLSCNKIIDIPTFNDHRFAMSFALMSMVNSNYIINNHHCVSKTYPKYWEDLKKLGIKILPTKKQSKNIVLIGMPSSGKTTLAKIVARELNMDRFDTDQMIENEFGPIKSFVRKNGWKEFRNLETLNLLNCMENNDEYKIISTGGGMVCTPAARKLLESSIVILIKGKHVNDYERELPSNYNNLEIERKNLYESVADYVYYNNGKPEEFTNWLKLIITNNPIPDKSFFLCKSNDKYENNIANFVEIRGDLIDNYGLDIIQKMMKIYNKQIIYTLRTKDEGGQFNGTDLMYTMICNRAVKLGARFVDIEVNKKINLNISNLITIGSIHSDDINYINNCINIFNENILKIVTNIENCKQLNMNKGIMNFDKKIIIDNMDGSYRIKNNHMTPLSSDNSNATAPNQLNTLEYLEKSHKDGKNFIFLFGNNIAHSPSSYIHNYVFRKNGINNIYYLNYETNDINQVNRLIDQPYFRGASVTMPFKEFLSMEDKLGAINTICKKGRFITYQNTDTNAIRYFIKEQETVILGTGGAAIGALDACEKSQIKNISVVGRNAGKLNKLKEHYNIKIYLFSTYKPIEENHNVINCLPPTVPIKDYINENTFMIDMTYGLHNHNKKPEIIKENNYINGYDILYVQAAYQFIYWFFDDYKIENILEDYKEAINKYKNEYIN